MKNKIWLLLLILLPLKVNALGICPNNASSCSFNKSTVHQNKLDNSYVTKINGSEAISKFRYAATVNGSYQDLFCMDANLYESKYIDRAEQMNSNSSFHKGLMAIYRLYLVDSNQTTNDMVAASDAMRVFVIRSGNKVSKNYINITDISRAGETLSGQRSNDTLTSQSNFKKIQKWYCAAARIAGISDGNTSTCKNVTSGLDLALLTETNFDAKFIQDTSVASTQNNTNGFSETITVSLSGTGYNNLKQLLNSFPKLKNTSYITVTKCAVDSASANLGYSCSVVNTNNILSNDGKVQIIVQNKNVVTTATSVKLNLTYNYHIPFDDSSLSILSCSGESGNCYTNSSSGIYIKNTTQRFILMEPNHTYTAQTNYEPTIDLKPSCKVVYENGKANYYVGDDKVDSVKEYMNAGCCADINRSNLTEEEENIYYEVCVPQSDKPACEYKNNNGTPVYRVSGKEVTEKEYLNAGCCNVEPSLLKDSDAIAKYKDLCQVNDTVYFEHECGTRTKIGTNVNKVSGSDVETLTCTNESYVDYTHSYVWQTPMSKIMQRVKTLEASDAYADNLLGFYSSSAISNYLDRSYLEKSVTSNGKTITGISADNNYCMLYTSESDDIYFPGTAVATSGRFFVFNELNVEECLSSLNPGPNCFRQPYIVGKIYGTMHTNFTKWEKDYLAAIEEEKATYQQYSANNSTENNQLYQAAKLARENLEKYKNECEAHNDLSTYWCYNLNPTLDFNYRQKVYGGSERTEDVTETVGMDISKEAVKYWPNVSSSVSVISGSQSGQKKTKNYTISYGNVNETKTFDQTEDYSIGYEQTLYYKPKQVTYATLPNGQYVLQNEEYQTNNSYMIENGLRVGYVYNVRLTTYAGTYVTSFAIDKLGHLGLNNVSNVQTVVDNYKKEHNITVIESECVYCNQEGEFKRQCDVCPDPDNPDLGASYVYRTISLSDVTPNERENTNWSDAKGVAAKERIQSLSGDNNTISALSNINGESKVVTLDNANNEKVKTALVAKGNIYDDITKEYLEYDFTLTTRDMQIIRKNTSRSDFDYGAVNFCKSQVGSEVIKDADMDYCFTCNQDGKECTSTFIDAFANADITAVTRETKWKYYINNNWVYGKMSTIEGFEDGRYPDPLNYDAYLNIYSNWP